MKRTQRIKRICQLQRLCENNAVATMKEARQKLSGARQLFSELEKHHGDYWTRLHEQEQAGLNSLMWRSQREFIRALEDAIHQQLGQIDVDNQNLDRSKSEWRQKHADTLAGKAFLNKILKRDSRGAEKREARATEDLVASRFGGRHR